MKAKLTILCENSVGRPFGVVGEHGFACFIETDAGNLLFDTGQGIGICGNAAAMGKDLGSVGAIALAKGSVVRVARCRTYGFAGTGLSVDRSGPGPDAPWYNQ